MRAFLAIALLGFAVPAFAEPGAGPVAKPGADKDKMICRRETPVGSLIASRKICRTKEEWSRVADEQNETARKLVYDNMTKPGGN